MTAISSVFGYYILKLATTSPAVDDSCGMLFCQQIIASVSSLLVKLASGEERKHDERQVL